MLKKIKDFSVNVMARPLVHVNIGIMLDQDLSGEAISNKVINKVNHVNARLRFLYR